jgi:hypothetical protein
VPGTVIVPIEKDQNGWERVSGQWGQGTTGVRQLVRKALRGS